MTETMKEYGERWDWLCDRIHCAAFKSSECSHLQLHMEMESLTDHKVMED